MTGMKEANHQQALPAKCVYVLKKKECPSKNAQVSWYFRNLNEVVTPRDKKGGADDDSFEVLSVIQPDNVSERRGSLFLSPDTQVTFISQRYSLVFVLHCNPSLATPGIVSNHVGVIFSSLSNSLRNVMKSLAKPFCIPGTTEQMSPEICYSILLFTSVSSCLMKQVLLHGSILSLDTIEDVLLQIEKELRNFETNMAAAFRANVSSMENVIGYNRDADSPVDHAPSDRQDSLSSPCADRNSGLISSEKIFVLMLRQCLLTLKLLGENSTSGVVVLTDGSVGMCDSSAFDITLQQLRSSHVAVSFVQLRETPSFFDGFEKCFYGNVPNVEFMQFISTVTGGAYFGRVPRLAVTGEPALTSVHRGILCHDLYRMRKLHPGIFSEVEPDAGELSHLSLEKSVCLDNWQVPLTTRSFLAYTITSSVMALVSCRVKEGYLLRYVQLAKGEGDETKMSVLLSLPWRCSVYIHYKIVSTWTGPQSRRQTSLEIFLEAPNRFITDLSNVPKLTQATKPIIMWYPKPTLKKCLNVLKNIQQTDKLLAHLRLFASASNYNYFNIPDGLKFGKPLLLCPASNQKDYVANPEVVNANTSEFHHFWKQMASVDTSNWQRWFDVHTLEVLLEHDEPMSRHIVSGASRLAHCRKSQEAFFQCLQRFTSFILVDKLSYVGIVYSASDKLIPVSYYVLKVEARTCHFVIHVGFIGDKCFSRQMEKINQLRKELSIVKIDQQSSIIPVTRIPHHKKPPKMVARPFPASNPTPTQGYHHSRSAKSGSSPEDGASSGSPQPLTIPSSLTLNCCHVLRKSIDKIQIIYDKVPQDFFKTDLVPSMDEKGLALSATAMATNMMTTISNMLLHHRWVWSLKESDSSPSLVSPNVMDRILYNIIRLRLDEGFHFIGCSQGIIRMVAEFEMLMKDSKDPKERETTCIVQFIIFPPSFLSGRSRNDSHQSDGPVAETGQSQSSLSREDGIHLIMECWVEPQSGVIHGENPKMKNFIGLEYHQIPQAIYVGDRKCISAFVTLEKLVHVCQYPDASLTFNDLLGEGSHPKSQKHHHHHQQGSNRFFLEPSSSPPASASHLASSTNHVEHHIDHVPFPFDPVALTTKCQQVELIFSLFSEDRSDTAWSAPSIFPATSARLDGAICPNSLAILLFNEQLKGLHSKEFNLPARDCQELIRSLRVRERDFSVRPLPFCYAPESMFGAKTGRAGHEEDYFGTGFSPSKDGGRKVEKEDDVDSVAQWKCYLRLIKSSSSGISGGGGMHHQQNLIITLVPCTYEDILKLNQVDHSSRRSSEDTKDNQGTTSTESRRGSKDGDSDQNSLKCHLRGFTLPDEASGENASGDGSRKDGSSSSTMRQTTFDATKSSSAEFKSQSKRSISQEGVTFAGSGYESKSEVTFIPEHPPSYWCGPVFPVYVYNCSTATFSDLLLNLRTTQKIPDLYEDLTFEDDLTGSHNKSSVLSQSPEKVTCLISSSRKVSECESTSSREKWRRAGDDLYKNQDDLKQHSTLVSETYLRCFVSAMYESLRSGQSISKKDVNAAIYNICEESRPMEIDITEFLRNSCKQIQGAFDSMAASQATTAAAAAATTATAAAVVSNSLLNEIKELELGIEESPQFLTLNKLLEGHTCDTHGMMRDVIKSRFLDIVGPYFTPVLSHPECLYCSETTRHRRTLESLNLKDDDKLSEVIERLIDAGGDQSDDYDFTDAKTASRTNHGRGSNTTLSNSATVAVSTASDDQCFNNVPISCSLQHKIGDDKQSSGGHARGVLNTLHSVESVDYEDSLKMEKALQRAKTCNPLFLNLTLSIRLGNKFFSAQVESIPVCGADLKACLQDIGDTPFDGANFRVTLDIYCLSLGMVEDLSTLKDRPCYSRLTSINSSSQRSTQTGSSDCEDEYVEEEDEEEEDDEGSIKRGGSRCTSDTLEVGSFESGERNKSLDHFPSSGTTPLRTSDSDKSARYHGHDYDDYNQEEGRGTRHYNLSHLPKSQQLLVLVCRNMITWLLSDEIVSSLRSVFPATEAILDRVTNHIRSSYSKHKTSQYAEVALQFVFGPEKSLSLFLEQFEKMKLDHVDKAKMEKLHLIRSGSYYYLCKPYSTGIASDGIQELNALLQNFHNTHHQLSHVQHRSSSMESSGLQKSENMEDHAGMDGCTRSDSCPASTSDDLVSRKRNEEASIEGNEVFAETRADGDPNVQYLSSCASPKSDHHLRKMAGIGGFGDDDDLEEGKSQARAMKETEIAAIDLKKIKYFNLTNQRASTPGINESRRLSYSAVTTISQPNRAVFASQTINTFADDSPATPPPMTSRAFVAISSNGDRYIKKVEGFSIDSAEMRRVRPISGPAGLDGGMSCLGTMSLLFPSRLPEKDGESREDMTAPTTAISSNMAISKVQQIKRAQSSTSFDKSYPSPVLSGQAGRGTSQQVGGQQPHRSRHTSGRDTPISAVDTSSITTGGYDADWSEIDDEGNLMSLDNPNPQTVRRRLLIPNFWQILKVLEDRVLVYFHCREIKQPNNGTKWDSVNREVVNNINKICHLINQKLLLKDLLDLKSCNPLLIAEADEDVKWSKDSKMPDDHHGNSKKKVPYMRFEYLSDSDDEFTGRRYLVASTQFSSGHFKCNEQYSKTFVIHPRLKSTLTKASSCSAAMTALRSKLSPFVVKNRLSTYVLLDSTEAIFYACLTETTCETSKVLSQPVSKATNDLDETKSQASHNSADVLTMKRMIKVDEEQPRNSPILRNSDLDLPSSTPIHPHSHPNPQFLPQPRIGHSKPKDKITMTVYGICRPDKQITTELVGVMQKELDDVVLESICFMFNRNPSTKLTTDDVHFIQRPGTAPAQQLKFFFPTSVILHQHAFGVYLRQNLQNYLILPKYHDPNNPENLFQPFSPQNERLVPPAPPLSAEFIRSLPGSFLCQASAQGSTPSVAMATGGTVAHSSSSSSLSSSNQHLALTSLQNNSSVIGGNLSNADQDILLYVRPQHDGNRGIACIHLAFVDGKGHPVHLLGSPKPSSNAYKELNDKNLYDALLQVNKYELDPKVQNSKSPGPVSLIQFSIWVCGNIDLDSLSAMLEQSIRHAIQDLVFEYRLLTAPISEVPFHYAKGVDSPLHSAPVSPRFNSSNFCWSFDAFGLPALRSALPPDLSRTSADLGRGKTSSEFTTPHKFPMLGERSATVTFDCDAAYMEEDPSTNSRLYLERSLDVDEELLKKIQMYEEGSKGLLNPVFVTLLPYWFNLCCKTGTPSVSKHQYSLVRFPAVELLLRKIPGMFTDQLGEVNIAFFREKTGSNFGSDPIYEPFEFNKELTQNSFDGNSTSNKRSNKNGATTYSEDNFIIVCRNVSQWRQSLEGHPYFAVQSYSSRMSSIQSPAPSSKTSKISYKKFPGLDEDSKLRSDSASFSPFSLPEKMFVPRQFLILVTCSKKTITMYQYNLSSDVVGNIDRHVMRHVYWHNARSHILDCIASQKCGLFQHTHYSEPPPEKFNKEPNPFLLTMQDFDQLISHAIIPSSVISQKMRNRSGSTAISKTAGMVPLSAPPPALTLLDQLYLNCKPAVPMQPIRGKDTLYRHGCQANNMKTELKQETLRTERMHKLYGLCEGRSSTSQTLTLSSSDLDLLKKSSRLIHQVMSPLLFSSLWQRESSLTTDSSFFIPSITTSAPIVAQNDGANQFEKKRSRHSSGSSVKSKRSDSTEQTAKRLGGTALAPISATVGNQPAIITTTSSGVSLDQLVPKPSHHAPVVHQLSLPVASSQTSQLSRESEPEWHKKICQYMIKQYISYLSPFYFYPLKVNASNQHGVGGANNDNKGSTPAQYGSNTTYMHKSLQGGLILVEVGFLPTHFYVTIYAFQAPASSINTQLSHIFTDECDKIKDAIHLNSFCHDFHLRVVQTFVQNESSPQSTILPPHYPVTWYLRELVSYFPYEPNYSWNYVHEESMTVPCGLNSPHQLFEYMNKHSVDMKSISMNPFMSEEDLPCMREHALICPLTLTGEQCFRDTPKVIDLQTFDAGLLLAIDGTTPISGDSAHLPLKFWIVLTNRYQIYPKDSLEKKKFSTSSTPSSPLFHSSKLCTNPSRVNFTSLEKSLSNKFRREQMDYLGYSNIHQVPLYVILQPVVHLARERIERLACEMSRYCYRDHLWMRLLVSDEESKRKRRTGEIEESKDPAMAKLSYAELGILLDLVQKVDLCQIDPRLRPILDLPMQVIHQLLSSLLDRFKTDSRYFNKSLDSNCMKKYLIILNPKALDVCIMFTVEDPKRDVDGSIVQQPHLSLLVREEAELSEDLKLSVRQHVENFVSIATYHLWAQAI